MDSVSRTLPATAPEPPQPQEPGASPPHGQQTISLPEHPLVSIRASSPLDLLPWKDLWAYRELLMFLVWRDLKVRYKQTFLGVAWALLQPLAATLIIAVFFGRFVNQSGQSDIPYPLYVYSGMLPWTFFANAVTNASNSLINNTNLITKVYFPRILIPAAAVGAGLLDLAIGAVVLLGLALYFGQHIGPVLLVLPFLGLLVAALALAVGVFMSSVSVRYRDARYLLPFLLQLWMFASPIIYRRELVPQQWQWVLVLNPMAGIMSAIRSIVAGAEWPKGSVESAFVITAVALVCAVWNFRRMERSFADVI